MKILTVVGARPQFIKAAMVSRALAADGRFEEVLVHTGQHYDDRMSSIFFVELAVPEPKYHLAVGSGRHGEQTGRILAGLEKVILTEEPDAVLVYGDTNSTVGGALAAVKLGVPVAHVEAGLRSFRKSMPEEINRVVTDHCSEILFCPSRAAVANLRREGIVDGVFAVGDVMYDAALAFGEIAGKKSVVMRTLGVEDGSYFLATVHRAESTDDPQKLRGILEGLRELSAERRVVFPLHPRTAKAAKESGLGDLLGLLSPTEPVSFFDMVCLERGAELILTDSGGVQKEAYFHRVPCVTMREETEWVETVEAGWNILAGTDPRRIVEAARGRGRGREIFDYGDGKSGEKIAAVMAGALGCGSWGK